jgi:hypothetical protein
MAIHREGCLKVRPKEYVYKGFTDQRTGQDYLVACMRREG